MRIQLRESRNDDERIYMNWIEFRKLKLDKGGAPDADEVSAAVDILCEAFPGRASETGPREFFEKVVTRGEGFKDTKTLVLKDKVLGVIGVVILELVKSKKSTTLDIAYVHGYSVRSDLRGKHQDLPELKLGTRMYLLLVKYLLDSKIKFLVLTATTGPGGSVPFWSSNNLIDVGRLKMLKDVFEEAKETAAGVFTVDGSTPPMGLAFLANQPEINPKEVVFGTVPQVKKIRESINYRKPRAAKPQVTAKRQAAAEPQVTTEPQAAAPNGRVLRPRINQPNYAEKKDNDDKAASIPEHNEQLVDRKNDPIKLLTESEVRDQFDFTKGDVLFFLRRTTIGGLVIVRVCFNKDKLVIQDRMVTLKDLDQSEERDEEMPLVIDSGDEDAAIAGAAAADDDSSLNASGRGGSLDKPVLELVPVERLGPKKQIYDTFIQNDDNTYLSLVTGEVFASAKDIKAHMKQNNIPLYALQKSWLSKRKRNCSGHHGDTAADALPNSAASSRNNSGPSTTTTPNIGCTGHHGVGEKCSDPADMIDQAGISSSLSEHIHKPTIDDSNGYMD
mmetsp:Transcript_3437/g.5251  ORF Transcript_3437/g.5251 Transcript_3437/m.5251 type:complete len:559 (-) Transcript_3437:673-2349(-)